jgi:hypothetical protein
MYEIKRLMADDTMIRAIDGEHICTLSMSTEQESLLHGHGWDKDNESWLAYRERTQKARDEEDKKRNELALDLVNSYNKLLVREGEQ